MTWRRLPPSQRIFEAPRGASAQRPRGLASVETRHRYRSSAARSTRTLRTSSATLRAPRYQAKNRAAIATELFDAACTARLNRRCTSHGAAGTPSTAGESSSSTTSRSSPRATGGDQRSCSRPSLAPPSRGMLVPLASSSASLRRLAQRRCSSVGHRGFQGPLAR